MARIQTWLPSMAALFLLSCTAGSGLSSVDNGRTDTAALYGEYLAASFADRLEASADESRYFSAAFNRDNANVGLGQRAFLAALEAGDIDQARTHAAKLQKLDPTEGLSRAFLSADAIRKKQWSKAKSYQTADLRDRSVELMMSLMRGWTAYGAGDAVAAKQYFEQIGIGDAFFPILGQLQIAEMSIQEGDFDAAELALNQVKASGQFSTATVLAMTDIYVGRGEIDEAKAALNTISDLNGGFASGPIRAQIDALNAGTYTVRQRSASQLAADALNEPALGFFARQGAHEAAEIFLRLALLMDPDSAKTKLWLGANLEQLGRNDDALEYYKSVPRDSMWGVSAMLSYANILFQNDDQQGALDLIQAAYDEEPTPSTRNSLARTHLAMENYDKALPIYNAIIASKDEVALKLDPTPFYYRGICYEQMDQWSDAEADFKKVLELDPDNADALNYLGYSYVDKGVNLTEAFRMIRKAVEQAPQSGAIVDSLGWAHFKLGQYEEARVNLEKAVALTPNSATIIDHLGDTYWKLGRFREAGYQWRRALDFEPTEDEIKRINAKLKGGLEAARGL